MAIIDIDSGHPLALRGYPRICIFMIPIWGEGGFFSTHISRLCPGILDTKETRKMGEVKSWRYDGRLLYALVAHSGMEYLRAPKMVGRFLNTLAPEKKPVSFVMNASDVPTHDRLAIMRELARCSLDVHVFEFKL